MADAKLAVLAVAALLAACASLPRPRLPTAGLAGPLCPEDDAKGSVARIQAATPSPEHRGENAVSLALCRYLAGDVNGAKAGLQAAEGLPRDNNGEAPLRAALALAEHRAALAKATLDQDADRLRNQSDARAMASTFRGSDAARHLDPEAPLTAAQKAEQLTRLRASLAFVRFVADAKPAYLPAQETLNEVEDLMALLEH
jgi:hypothetical protein